MLAASMLHSVTWEPCGTAHLWQGCAQECSSPTRVRGVSTEALKWKLKTRKSEWKLYFLVSEVSFLTQLLQLFSALYKETEGTVTLQNFWMWNIQLCVAIPGESLKKKTFQQALNLNGYLIIICHDNCYHVSQTLFGTWTWACFPSKGQKFPITTAKAVFF